MSRAVEIDEYRLNARDWLRKTKIPNVPLGPKERFDVLRGWQHQLFEAGWLGIHWPQPYGGQGLSVLHHLAFSDELAAAGAPQPIGSIGLEVVGPSILEHGTEGQRKRLLPPLLSGDEIWCQGFSEPDAGSDLASLRTRAEVKADHFVVRGQKVWTSWAHEASWCALLVRSDPEAPKHEGISYLLAEMDAPEITVKPLINLTGDAEFNEVFFDDVLIPRENILGRLNEGWRIAMHTLGRERGTYALRRKAQIEAAFRQLIGTLKAETTTELGEQALMSLGHAFVQLRVLNSQTRRTVNRLIEESGPSPLDSVDKLLLNATEQFIFGAAFDLLGPARMMSEGHILGLETARWTHDYLFSRAASIYGGTSQIQRNIIARRELGLRSDLA